MTKTDEEEAKKKKLKSRQIDSIKTYLECLIPLKLNRSLFTQTSSAVAATVVPVLSLSFVYIVLFVQFVFFFFSFLARKNH